MKQAQHVLFVFILFVAVSAQSQNVGIGVSTAPAKLTVVGPYSNPSIPNSTSTGIFRIGAGVTGSDGIDFGKMGGSPFSGWIQVGYNGTTADPLSLQPMGGTVGIGTPMPAASAMLDISSTSKGFLPPRMTTIQRDAIASPDAGLVIFNTTTNSLDTRTSTKWVSLSTAADAIPSIQIGTQKWMTKNLDVAFYRNGDPIPQVSDAVAWAGLTTGAWCYANTDSTLGTKYGKLYNWYAVNDPRGLAPTGWHVPNDAEWTTLENTFGGPLVAGGYLKEAGTLNWISPNTAGNNNSGFAALPGGLRQNNGTFSAVNGNGYWWSSSEVNTVQARYRYLSYSSGNFYTQLNIKQWGLSVRCLRD